jgi:hypothetical protein
MFDLLDGQIRHMHDRFAAERIVGQPPWLVSDLELTHLVIPHFVGWFWQLTICSKTTDGKVQQ